MRILKFFVALLLLPACWGGLLGFWESIVKEAAFFKTQWPFLAGVGFYLILTCLIQHPLRTYVFGHELTHALWVWVFKGKVKGFSVSKGGGVVETTKSNFVIALAPYFFPVYSVLVILLYFLARAFWNVTPYFNFLIFILGVSWGFHIVLNLYALFKGQQEVRETGVLFSITLIFLLNLLILGGLLVFTSPVLSAETYLTTFLSHIKTEYVRLYDYAF